MNDLKRITSLSVKFDKKRFYKQHIAVAMENNLFECAFELNLGLLELKISKEGKRRGDLRAKRHSSQSPARSACQMSLQARHLPFETR